MHALIIPNTVKYCIYIRALYNIYSYKLLWNIHSGRPDNFHNPGALHFQKYIDRYIFLVICWQVLQSIFFFLFLHRNPFANLIPYIQIPIEPLNFIAGEERIGKVSFPKILQPPPLPFLMYFADGSGDWIPRDNLLLFFFCDCKRDDIIYIRTILGDV